MLLEEVRERRSSRQDADRRPSRKPQPRPAAKWRSRGGVPTIIDVERVRPGIGALLQQIDAIAAQDFPTALTGYDDPGRAIEASGASLVRRWSRSRWGGTAAGAADAYLTPASSIGRQHRCRRCLSRRICVGLSPRPPGEIEEAPAHANAAPPGIAGHSARVLACPEDEVDQLLLARLIFNLRRPRWSNTIRTGPKQDGSMQSAGYCT